MEGKDMLRSTMSAILFVLAAAVPIHAHGDNLEISEQIRDQIKTYIDENSIRDYAICVGVKDGMATLTGHLKSQEQVAAAVRIARQHPKIREVRNDLKIQPEPTPPLIPPPAPGRASTPRPVPREVPLARQRNLKLRDTLRGHTQPVYSVAYSPDGKTLASGSFDKTIRLWDVAAGKCTAVLKAFASDQDLFVESVAFSPDGKTLASSGSWDGGITLWDVSQGTSRAVLKGHSFAVLAVAYSPDGKTLISGSADETVKLWDVATAKCIRTLTGHSGHVNSVRISPDGKTAASGSCDATIRLWNVAAGDEIGALKGHTDWVCSIAFAPDGKTLASASRDTQIKFWDVNKKKEVATRDGYTGIIDPAAGWTGAVSSIAFSPDGGTLASGAHDNAIRIWDAISRDEVAAAEGRIGEAVGALAFGPSGNVLAVGCYNTTIELWEVQPARGSQK
jgi:WD40 repeat protein